MGCIVKTRGNCNQSESLLYAGSPGERERSSDPERVAGDPSELPCASESVFQNFELLEPQISQIPQI